MSTRLADSLTALIRQQAGLGLRLGTHVGAGSVDVGGGSTVKVTAWLGTVPATGSRVALLIQRGSVLAIGVTYV